MAGDISPVAMFDFLSWVSNIFIYCINQALQACSHPFLIISNNLGKLLLDVALPFTHFWRAEKTDYGRQSRDSSLEIINPYILPQNQPKCPDDDKHCSVLSVLKYNLKWFVK